MTRLVIKFGFHLTTFGQSLLLLICEFLVNAICWIVAALLFREPETRRNLNLALLAWTLGLRHAIDADHISAIDNATRSLISIGQLPVTCGLFFSLGHSTIVICVTIAIAISSAVYNRITGVGEAGGIIGPAVSGSFLFIIGLANTIILWRIFRQRRRVRRKLEQDQKNGYVSAEPLLKEGNQSMLMTRILGPIIAFVNRPWKMYPVGVLFGFGFDTASSIALLAISIIASQNSEGQHVPSSYVVILPLLFTAGMTLVDSLDSILMLYSYAGLLKSPTRWKIVESSSKSSQEKPDQITQDDQKVQSQAGIPSDQEVKGIDVIQDRSTLEPKGTAVDISQEQRIQQETEKKIMVMSTLSIVLTVMSILLAFAISLITIMGLIGEQCSQCMAAAEAEDGGGLAGSWWRGWANAGEHSGFIGAGIVGTFLLIVSSWYLGSWLVRKSRPQRVTQTPATET